MTVCCVYLVACCNKKNHIITFITSETDSDGPRGLYPTSVYHKKSWQLKKITRIKNLNFSV